MYDGIGSSSVELIDNAFVKHELAKCQRYQARLKQNFKKKSTCFVFVCLCVWLWLWCMWREWHTKKNSKKKSKKNTHTHTHTHKHTNKQ